MLGKTMKNDPNLIKHLRSAMHARGAEAHVPGTLRNAQGRKSDTELSMNDDGFHFSEYQDHSHKLFYVEWWYYNFCDPGTGLTGRLTARSWWFPVRMLRSRSPSVTPIPNIHVVNYSTTRTDSRSALLVLSVMDRS